MRVMWINPIVVLLAAACGYGLCAAFGWDPHVKDLALAAVGILVVSEVAMLPLVLQFDKSVAGVSQAALIGTLVHLMTGIMFVGFVLFSLKPDGAFLYWVLTFYWVTLVSLVVSFVRAVQSATSSAPPAPVPHAKP